MKADKLEQPIVNILLVDDKYENLLALDAVLSNPSYNLVKARSGKEALMAILHEEFAVILMDIHMPEMDGFETATLIRKREKSRATPIIFITAVYGDSQHIGQGYQAGAVDYIVKPFIPHILKSKVAVFAELYLSKKEVQRQTEIIFKEREERIKYEALHRHYDDIVNWLDHSIIWEADPKNLQFSFISKFAVELLGYPHEQWLNEPGFFFKHLHPEDLDRVKAIFQKAIQNNQNLRCEHRLITADGNVLWFHTGIQTEHRDSEKSNIIRGLTVEITPWKQEEEELKKREAKFRRVVESNMLGHIFTTLSGLITSANECFLNMTGYTREDISSGTLRWDEITPTEYRLSDEAAIQELRSTGICSPYEKEFISKDGIRIPVMIGSAMLEGSIEECVSFVLDLTEKKQVEEEKNRAIRAREELLEIVSHDLRNPLGAVLMNAALLYRKVPVNPDPQIIRKHLNTIQRSAEQMQHLIEDLLDLAKVEAGRLVISKTKVDVDALLNEAYDMFSSLIEQKSIQIEKEWLELPKEISCDHDRMLQVFSNLLGNAIKFTPEGGQIRLKAIQTNHDLEVTISDSGPGIPKDQLPHIFDRYWQAQKIRQEGGLGLGLSIAKGIVLAHSGRIWAESELGHGTTFHFTIPLLEIDAPSIHGAA